jgi:hypothetical protein
VKLAIAVILAATATATAGPTGGAPMLDLSASADPPEPGQLAPGSALTGTPLRGPYRSIAKLCAAELTLRRKEAAANGDDTTTYTCARAGADVASFAKGAAPHLAAPFTDAVMIAFAERGGAVPWTRCALTVATAAGYFVDPDPPVCLGPLGDEHDANGLSIHALAVTPMFSTKQPVLRVEAGWRERVGSIDMGPHGEKVTSDDFREDTTLRLCAVGRSRRPSCTPSIATRARDWGTPAVTLTVTPTAKGVEITADAKGDPDVDAWAKGLGAHPVVFP